MITFSRGVLRRVDLHARLPFSYGITTMTALPHVILDAEWRIDGDSASGLAAENLPPKWFTKVPEAPIDGEIGEMLTVIRQTIQLAEAIPPAPSVFAWWLSLQNAMSAWGRGQNMPPLLLGLGTSLVERSLLDAFCRKRTHPLAQAVAANSLGIDLGALHPELAGSVPGDWLPPRPLERVTLRHTVGLSDALAESDIAPKNRLNDGLPESLEAAVRAYGLRHFKLKLGGEAKSDSARLRRTFDLLDALAPADWRFSLDGNENFPDAPAFRALWTEWSGETWLKNRRDRLLFVEQPVRRATALGTEADWRNWRDAPPIIIDESDGAPGDLRTALGLGYAGVSHKNCKGVFRGIANACLLRHRGGSAATRPLLMSGEDLANTGPIALTQDLAVQALLGNSSVERNGHHYFAGLSAWPEPWQQTLLAEHSDLFLSRSVGSATLRIDSGHLHLGSVNREPFGTVSRLLDVGDLSRSSKG